ncbi:hypothetical protein Cpir12675_001450 [Ceratocystis pirilliformis]|uniref:Uncharacterized protein n=1 Tax=Ceratocystis pirilliformis TaxID=259994 RepID=A0ABR3ZG33_9PEZI
MVCSKTSLNWEKWSRQTTRNLRGFDILYLFKGLEEEVFQKATNFEKSPQKQPMDESNAMAVVRTGLNEEDKELSNNTETPKSCCTLLKCRHNKSNAHRSKYIFADLDKYMGKQWKVGDRASSRWYSLRTRISNYQGMSDLSKDSTTDNSLATFVIKR